jgi:hypothetical protein
MMYCLPVSLLTADFLCVTVSVRTVIDLIGSREPHEPETAAGLFWLVDADNEFDGGSLLS